MSKLWHEYKCEKCASNIATGLTSRKSFYCFTSQCLYLMQIMQHLGVNCGCIWRFKLGFFICFFAFFLLKKAGLIFKSPVATLPRPLYSSLRHVVNRHVAQCHYISILIRFHVMYQNTSVSSIKTLLVVYNRDANTAFVTIRELKSTAAGSLSK